MNDILNKPDWIPWYVQRVKGSDAWKKLKDYQFGWYVRLLTELADSDTPGYLPNDVGVLWKLAGAQTESFFRHRGGIELLARHFNRTEDGLRIYNERMLNVLYEQGNKRAKKRRQSLSSLSLSLQKVPDWVPSEEFGKFIDMRKEIGKPLTAHAVKLLVTKLEKLKGEGHDPKTVLEESILNDWQSVWPLHENGDNGSQEATRKTEPRSAEQENCPTCRGSGWDLTSGKARRCACRQCHKTLAKAAAAAG